MYLLGLALVLTLLKYLDIGPVGHWPWWWIGVPYAAAAAWWWWADTFGYTKRREVEKIEQRKQDRINRQKEALGVRPRKR